MRVLFLDIDGVVNSEEYARERAKGGMLDFDPKLVAKVNEIIDRTGCAVVLSSTWRLSEDLREQVRSGVCHFIDVTADFPGKPRGIEVAHWLAQHPEVRQYAILDDDSDFMPGQHLFKTTFAKGLTDEIKDDVIKHFVGANEALQLPRDKMRKLRICFDIDGTLRSTRDPKANEPNTRWHDVLRTFAKRTKNVEVYVWSGGGKQYAEMYVRQYNLPVKESHCISKIGAPFKPDIAIDDIQDTALGEINLIVKEK